MIRKLFSLVTIVLFLGVSAQSQDMEVGLTAGGCYYLGDLNPGKHFMNTEAAYGVVARYNIDTRWAVKISAVHSNIRGNSSSSTFLPGNELSFTSALTDIEGVAEFNFMPYFTGSRVNAISPYIYGGFSVFFFNPVRNGVSLQSIGTEGQNAGIDGRTPYAKVGFSIPFGLGVKWSISKSLGLQAFWEMHKTFTDYLDDVSTTYYLVGSAIAPDDQNGILSDPTRNHKPGMQRGNASNKDWYAFFGIALTYKFNLISAKRCRELNH